MRVREMGKLPIGSEVLVPRQNSNSRTGPFRMMNLDGETVVIQLPKGRIIVRSSCVRPYTRSALSPPETMAMVSQVGVTNTTATAGRAHSKSPGQA